MTKKVLTGDDAFDILNEGQDSGEKNEFAKFTSGTTYVVKVPGLNMISDYVYGSFNKKINSFVAQNPSKKSQKGFPIEDLTPFDLAWKHYKDKSDDWQDEMSQEASHYRCQRKFTIGFYNLDNGEPITVEFTRNQAQAVVETIKKYQARLNQFAFELSKTGQKRDTVVSLSLMPVLEDLTETQQKNFAECPDDFDAKHFEGLYYEMTDEEQLEVLHRAGFDLTLIGKELPKKASEDEEPADVLDGVGDITDEEYSF